MRRLKNRAPPVGSGEAQVDSREIKGMKGVTMTPVLTRSYDPARSGSNNTETVLTVNAVAARGIKLLGALNVLDDPRIEAQPLIVPGITCGDGMLHDLVIVCSQGNTVYAYDANTLGLIWAQRIGNPVDGSAKLDEYAINPHWGILSTPVINQKREMLHVCCWSSPDGTPAKARFYLHNLMLMDGREILNPCDLTTASYQSNGTKIEFGAAARKQRAALLMIQEGTTPIIIIAFGSVSESLDSARGWLIAVNGDTSQIVGTWASTSKYSGAGIWQAGEGPAADASGDIYVVTGNGAFDPPTDFGESFVKLGFTLKNGFEVVDWWSPFSDAGRVGEPQDQPQITVTEDDLRDTPSNMNDWNDQDLGSAGPLLITDLKLVLGAGKDGILYTVTTAAMGRTKNADFVTPADNYKKLAAPPVWFTFFPGWNHTPAPQKFTDLNVNYFQRTHHLHGTALHYVSKQHGHMLFCMGENGPLRAFKLNVDATLTFIADGNEYASPGAPVPPGGMPGGMLTQAGGIVWALVPYGDANKQITPGMLYAYDAENFVQTQHGPKLRLIWSSTDWGWQFMHPKFNLPVVSGGKLFVPTYDGRVLVCGLA